MHLSVPTGSGQSMVRAQIRNNSDKTVQDFVLSGGGYCAAGTETAGAKLRFITHFDQTGGYLPPGSFAFARAFANGRLEPDRCHVWIPQGTKAGEMFELIYRGEPAKVMGLGEAAIRDFADNMKGRGPPTILNGFSNVGVHRTVLAFGYSQTARLLRDFLYRGFNADAEGRRVFDGMLIASAGAGRGSFDHRYAMPGNAGNSVMTGNKPVDIFPFSETAESDLAGGATGQAGLLTALDPATIPRIMNTFSSSEYWARVGSLLTTSPDLSRNLPLNDNSRLYYFPGSVHEPSTLKDTAGSTIANTPFRLNYSGDMQHSLNALMDDLFRWAHDDVAPPPSAYPTLNDGLVAAKTLFLRGLDVKVPQAPPPVWQLDFGAAYAINGIITNEPPVVGNAYPLLVPSVDAYGNEQGGWKGPIASVPLGTYTAWYPPPAALKSFGYLSGLQGGFIPFERTRVDRLNKNDGRTSIEELYGPTDPKAEFQRRAEAAIDKAVTDRMLLPEEKDRELKFLMASWSWIVEGHAPPPSP